MTQKILFISHDATRTGAPIVFLHLLRWIRENTDIRFEIVLKDGGPLEEEFRNLAVTHVLNWTNDCPGRSAQARKLQELAGRDFTLIYSNTIANGQLLEHLAACPGPILTHVHELEYRIRHQTHPDVWNGVALCSDHYIAAAHAVKQNLVRNHGIPDRAVTVVHEFVPTAGFAVNHPDRGRIRESLGIPPDCRIVGSCGTSDWRKGPDLFIQLASMLRRRISEPVHFCWLGAQTDSRDFAALAYDVEKAGLSDCVHFISPQPDPSGYLSNFDVFVCMSREDPFPLVNLEAAACSIPIVCFDGSGGSREFVQDDCGYVVGYLDLEEMCSRVADILMVPELRARMGARAREKTRAYDVAVAAPKILQVIEEITGAWSPADSQARALRASKLGKSAGAGFRGAEPQDLFALLADPLVPKDLIQPAFHELLIRLQNSGFFLNLYNFASWQLAKGEKSRAKKFLLAVSRFAAEVNPELAGKAFFKLGAAADDLQVAADAYRRCLHLCPSHKAAREKLAALGTKENMGATSVCPSAQGSRR